MKRKLSDIKWATCIPLIGGSAIGCSQKLGTKPEYHVSYTPFNYNETQIEAYWPDVHRFIVNSEEFALTDLPDTKIDFVNAVCPCAGLSMLNHHASVDSQTNDWMYESTEFILKNIQPKVLWGENAPALSTIKGKPVADKIAEIGRKYGYSYSMIRTNAKEHGLPQNRQRTFYFLWKSSVAPLIGYYKRKSPNLRKYLAQIPEDATQQDLVYRSPKTIEHDIEANYLLKVHNISNVSEYIKTMKRGSFCVDILSMKDGANKFIKYLESEFDADHNGAKRLKRIYTHIINKSKDGKGFMDASLCYSYNGLNAWVGRTPHNMIHPSGTRFYNVREMLHIMGLPHDFELQNWQHNINTVCQNVPVPTTFDFVTEVARFCLGDKNMVFAPGNYVIQNNKTRNIEVCKMIW